MAINQDANRDLSSEHDKFIKASMGIKVAFQDYLNNFMPPEN